MSEYSSLEMPSGFLAVGALDFGGFEDPEAPGVCCGKDRIARTSEALAIVVVNSNRKVVGSSGTIRPNIFSYSLFEP